MTIKKTWLLVIPFLLMSCQCEEDILDDRFQTNLVVQNDTSFDLILEVIPNDISLLPSQTNAYIDGNSSETGFILPSEFEFLNLIRLYKRDEEENLILVYEQSPINDDLWVINESTTKNVDHVLVITEEILND